MLLLLLLPVGLFAQQEEKPVPKAQRHREAMIATERTDSVAVADTTELAARPLVVPDSVLTLIFPPVSLKAKWFVLIFAAIELLTGISSIRSVGGGIAHFAHLGGMLFGWLLILYWKKRKMMY